MMTPLNLPPFEWQLRKADNVIYIYDIIRKKYVQLTPEEWVRQHYLHFLIAQGYAKGRLQIEGGLSYNTLAKRADIVAWDAWGKPYLVVECKAPHIKLSAEVWAQAKLYNTIYQAPYIAITNGLMHLYGSWSETKKQYEALDALPPTA
jgi:type I site-specific restriction endonuclease